MNVDQRNTLLIVCETLLKYCCAVTKHLDLNSLNNGIRQYEMIWYFVSTCGDEGGLRASDWGMSRPGLDSFWRASNILNRALQRIGQHWKTLERVIREEREGNRTSRKESCKGGLL